MQLSPFKQAGFRSYVNSHSCHGKQSETAKL